MDMKAYKDEIVTKLGGDCVKIDIADNGTLDKLVQQSFRECQRYLNITKLKTVNYAPCITMDNGSNTAATINTGEECLSVIDVMRANVGSMGLGANYSNEGFPDALYLSMVTTSSTVGLNGGMLDGYKNLMQWRQVANTITTDLRFEYDTITHKLYVNAPNPRPNMITIRYTPRFKDVQEITDPFWEDIILRMTLAHAKITLGRVRGRYNLSNALWGQDAETLLSEGNAELSELRLFLQDNVDSTISVY